MATPEEELALLNNLLAYTAEPTSASVVATPVPSEQGISQQDVISGLKTTGGIGMNLASALSGATVGAELGAPFAPFTAGLSVPVGAVVGGAAGSYLGDVGWKQLTDWAQGKTAEQTAVELPKTSEEALAQAGLGAGIETGIRGLGYIAPSVVRQGAKIIEPVAKYATTKISNIGSALSDALIAKSPTEAKTIAADTLEKLGATASQVEAGVKTLPKEKAATLYDVVPTKEIAQAQALLSRTSAGAQPLSDIAQKQVEQIGRTFDNLIPAKLKDLTTEEIGTQLKTAYDALRDPAFEKAGARYTGEMLKAKVPVKGLEKSIDQYLINNFGKIEAVPTPILDAANKIKSILPTVRPDVSQKAMGFGVELAGKAAVKTPKTVPLQALQEVRSELLKNVRATKDWGTQHHVVELVQKITDTLGQSQQGKELIAANTAYKDMIERWFRSDLAKAMDKPATDIIENLSKSSGPIKQFEQTFGKLTPQKGQLTNTPAQLFAAGKAKEFALKRDPATIANWVAENENALRRTGLWPSFQSLVKEGEKTAKYTAQAGTKGMQKQTVEQAKLAKPVRNVFARYAGDVAEEATTGKEIGSQLATMLKGAVRPITQRMVGSPIGTGITTSILGGAGVIGGIPAAPAIVLAGSIAATTAQIARVAQKNEALVGEQLVKAFTDPKYAAKLLKEKAKQQAAKAALAESRQTAYQAVQTGASEAARTLAKSPLITPLSRGIVVGQQLQSSMDQQQQKDAELALMDQLLLEQ